MSPQLTIVIPTWNTAAITLKCVKSIKRCLPKNYFQIVIVDNASTDNTEDLLSKLPDLIYLRNPQNYGYSKACNIGAHRSSTDLILFLNSDMEFIDSSLLKMASFLQSHPDCGLVGPQYLNPDKSIQSSVFPPQTIKNAFKEFFLKNHSFSKYYPTAPTPLAVWAVSGGAVLINKSVLNKIDGWNEKYFMYFEDLDLCRKIRKSNLKIYYYPSCKVIHWHGASGSSLADSENQWRRLIPSSIKYHGYFNHKLINFIIWSGLKWQKVFSQK